MKSWFNKLVARVISAWAPGLVAQLLAMIPVKDISGHLRPHVIATMEALPPEWRRPYAEALQRLADIVKDTLADLEK